MADTRYNVAIPIPQNGAAILSGESATGVYFNDSGFDLVVTKIGLPIKLAAAFAGAIAGTEVVREPHPNSVENTMPARSHFRVSWESASREKLMNIPVSVAGFLNPDGDTYLEVALRIPANSQFFVTLYNDGPAAVTAQLVLHGRREE